MLADTLNRRWRLTVRSAFYAVSLALAILSVVCAFLDISGFSVILLVMSTGVLALLARYENMFHMTWIIAHLIFCVTPSLISLTINYPTGYELSALCTVMTVVALVLTDRIQAPIHISWKPGLILFNVTIATSLVILVATDGQSFLYTIMTIIFVFFALSQCAHRFKVAIAYIILVGYVFIYYSVFWDDFGRLILAGSLIVPTIVVLNKYRVIAAKYIIMFVVTVSGVLSTFLRYTGANLDNVLQTSMNDSNSGPLLLGQTFIEKSSTEGVLRLREWFDQVILLVLAPWPRIWWPEKPFGFGAVWVVENMRMRYWGHSIASTFMGEHIYFLGLGFGIAGAFASVLVIAAAYNRLQQSPALLGLGGSLIAIFLPTFYWGGMASFASRFWVGFIPLVVVIMVISALRASTGRTHRTVGAIRTGHGAFARSSDD